MRSCSDRFQILPWSGQVMQNHPEREEEAEAGERGKVLVLRAQDSTLFVAAFHRIRRPDFRERFASCTTSAA